MLQDWISLTREQRLERARAIVGAALGLALVGSGWRRRSAPGEFHIDRDGERLDPFILIRHLSDGTLSQDAWAEKCRALGIEGVPLGLRR